MRTAVFWTAVVVLLAVSAGHATGASAYQFKLQNVRISSYSGAADLRCAEPRPDGRVPCTLIGANGEAIWRGFFIVDRSRTRSTMYRLAAVRHILADPNTRVSTSRKGGGTELRLTGSQGGVLVALLLPAINAPLSAARPPRKQPLNLSTRPVVFEITIHDPGRTGLAPGSYRLRIGTPSAAGSGGLDYMDDDFPAMDHTGPGGGGRAIVELRAEAGTPAPIGGRHVAGANFVFADGSVRFFGQLNCLHGSTTASTQAGGARLADPSLGEPRSRVLADGALELTLVPRSEPGCRLVAVLPAVQTR